MKEKRLSEIKEQISHTFEKAIKNLQFKDVDEFIEKTLSQLDSKIQQDFYTDKLVKKFEKEGIKIDKKSVQKDIKKYSSNPEMRIKTSLTSLMSLTPPIQIIEVIRTEEGLRYCLPDFEIKDSLEVDSVIYKLPQQVNLVKLPTERFIQIGFTESEHSLFEQVESFIYGHLDLPQDFDYKILTLWIFHTWLLDKFNSSPIIHFLGPYASGKSRGGDTLGALAKRGLCTVNLTGAPIFRVSELYQPTFIIDEVKLTGKDRDRDILELLNARFQRGRKVIRINTEKSGLDSIQQFDVFGATILSGLDELPETPRSRAFVFIMEQNIRSVANSIDSKRADILRDKLCAFRGRYIEERMPKVDRFLKDGRLADAVEPLHQILKIIKPEIEPDFIEYFKKMEIERCEETYDSFDAEVVRALLKCQDKVDQGKILVSHVTENFNQGKTESEQLSKRTIGRVLSRLGLKKIRTTGGIHARFWDGKRIERLCRKYGLNEKDNDVSDVSDVKNLKIGVEKNISTKKKIEIRDFSEVEDVEVIE